MPVVALKGTTSDSSAQLAACFSNNNKRHSDGCLLLDLNNPFTPIFFTQCLTIWVFAMSSRTAPLYIPGFIQPKIEIISKIRHF